VALLLTARLVQIGGDVWDLFSKTGEDLSCTKLLTDVCMQSEKITFDWHVLSIRLYVKKFGSLT
jgi:hypothetical protein